MVKFWDDMRQRERSKIVERIAMSEKHGVGLQAMAEKERLKKIDKLIQESKQ